MKAQAAEAIAFLAAGHVPGHGQAEPVQRAVIFKLAACLGTPAQERPRGRRLFVLLEKDIELRAVRQREGLWFPENRRARGGFRRCEKFLCQNSLEMSPV